MSQMEKVDAKTELEFVTKVAEECITNMSEEEKHYMRLHPCSLDYHFSYGVYIRNQYIYNKDFSNTNFISDPDYLSMKILNMIIAKLIPEYKYGHPFYDALYSDKEFLDLREQYWNLHQTFPDDHIEDFFAYVKRECLGRKTYSEREMLEDCKKQLAEKVNVERAIPLFKCEKH